MVTIGDVIDQELRLEYEQRWEQRKEELSSQDQTIEENKKTFKTTRK
jgi:hypothetical protein